MHPALPGEKPGLSGSTLLDGDERWGHVGQMVKKPPTIDMLPDGTFRELPHRRVVPFSVKLMVGAILVTVLAVSIAVAALAVWVVSLVLPVIIIGGAVAWGMLKYRQWQGVRNPGSYVVPPRYPGGFGQ